MNVRLKTRTTGFDILRIGLLLVVPLTLPADLTSQVGATPDRSLSIIAVEGPKEKDVQAIAVGEGAAWLLTNDQLLRIDSGTGTISNLPTERIKTWHLAFHNAAIGAGSLWVSGEAHKIKGVHRIDLHTGKIVASIPFHYRFGEVAFGEGFAWTLIRQETLARIDPLSNQVSGTIDLGKGYMEVKFGNASVWTIGLESGTIKRIDPQLAKVAEEFSAGPAQDTSILKSLFQGGIYLFTAADGMLWVANNKRMSNGKYVLSRFDPKTHERLSKIEADDAYGAPVIWNGALWLSGMGYLTKVNLETNHIAERVVLAASDDGRAVSGTLMTDGHTLWAVDTGSWAYSKVVISCIQAKVSDSGGN